MILHRKHSPPSGPGPPGRPPCVPASPSRGAPGVPAGGPLPPSISCLPANPSATRLPAESTRDRVSGPGGVDGGLVVDEQGELRGLLTIQRESDGGHVRLFTGIVPHRAVVHAGDGASAGLKDAPDWPRHRHPAPGNQPDRRHATSRLALLAPRHPTLSRSSAICGLSARGIRVNSLPGFRSSGNIDAMPSAHVTSSRACCADTPTFSTISRTRRGVTRPVTHKTVECEGPPPRAPRARLNTRWGP